MWCAGSCGIVKAFAMVRRDQIRRWIVSSSLLCLVFTGLAAGQADPPIPAKKTSHTATSASKAKQASSRKSAKPASSNTSSKSAASRTTTSRTTAQRASSSGKASSSKKSKNSRSNSRSASRSAKGSKQVAKARGQQAIDTDRAREIQTALIRERYMDGEPTGTWDSATQAAMQRYQAAQGWQSKTTPDSRALIKLGLGPSHDHLLNPENAMTTAPAASDPRADPKTGAKQPPENNLPQQ
jgi:membrane-bound lytic murein transglycosylase